MGLRPVGEKNKTSRTNLAQNKENVMTKEGGGEGEAS